MVTFELSKNNREVIVIIATMVNENNEEEKKSCQTMVAPITVSWGRKWRRRKRLQVRCNNNNNILDGVSAGDTGNAGLHSPIK